MVVADCHVHTTNSDGTLTLDAIPEAARRAGVAVVAVTDHDRLHPDLDAPVVDCEGETGEGGSSEMGTGEGPTGDGLAGDGLTVVHGIELRVDAGDQRLDLLGYGVERTDALVAETGRLQRDRIERGAAIIENVEDRLGRSIPVEARPGIGRPHVARAIADVTEHDVAWAFRELIGNDGPCYVSRDVPAFSRGRDLLDDAAAIVGLAHPLRYPDPEAALDRCASLDAVEREYPYDEGYPYDDEDPSVDLAPVDRTIEAHDLLPTGGTDAHDETLGIAGLDSEGADRFLAALE